MASATQYACVRRTLAVHVDSLLSGLDTEHSAPLGHHIQYPKRLHFNIDDTEAKCMGMGIDCLLSTQHIFFVYSYNIITVQSEI